MFIQMCVLSVGLQSADFAKYKWSCASVLTNLAGYKGTIQSLERLTNYDICPHVKESTVKVTYIKLHPSSDSTKHSAFKLSKS